MQLLEMPNELEENCYHNGNSFVLRCLLPMKKERAYDRRHFMKIRYTFPVDAELIGRTKGLVAADRESSAKEMSCDMS